MRRSTSGNNFIQPSKLSFDFEEQLNSTNATSVMNSELDYWEGKMLRSKLIKKKETIEIFRQELDFKYKEHRQKISQKQQANFRVLEDLKYLIAKEKHQNYKLISQIHQLKESNKSAIRLQTVSAPSFQRDLQSVSFSFCG